MNVNHNVDERSKGKILEALFLEDFPESISINVTYEVKIGED